MTVRPSFGFPILACLLGGLLVQGLPAQPATPAAETRAVQAARPAGVFRAAQAEDAEFAKLVREWTTGPEFISRS